MFKLCARIGIIAGVRRITDVHNQDERLAVYRVCKHFEHDLGRSILIQEKDSYTLNSTMLKSVKMLFTYYPHLLVWFFNPWEKKGVEGCVVDKVCRQNGNILVDCDVFWTGSPTCGFGL